MMGSHTIKQREIFLLWNLSYLQYILRFYQWQHWCFMIWIPQRDYTFLLNHAISSISSPRYWGRLHSLYWVLYSIQNVIKWLINISSLNTSSLSDSNSWQNCNYRLEHTAFYMEMKETLCLAWFAVLAELLWWFVPMFCPGPQPALHLQRKAVSFTYSETSYVILINSQNNSFSKE